MVNKLHSLAFSPSFQSLLSCLYIFQGESQKSSEYSGEQGQRTTVARTAIAATLKAILAEPDDQKKKRALLILLSSPILDYKDTERDPDLEVYIVSNFNLAMQGSENDWKLFSEALRRNGNFTLVIH